MRLGVNNRRLTVLRIGEEGCKCVCVCVLTEGVVPSSVDTKNNKI
jgi:hypothetical protein